VVQKKLISRRVLILHSTSCQLRSCIHILDEPRNSQINTPLLESAEQKDTSSLVESWLQKRSGACNDNTSVVLSAHT